MSYDSLPNWLSLLLLSYAIYSGKRWVKHVEKTLQLLTQVVLVLVQEHNINHPERQNDYIKTLTQKILTGD